MYRLNPVRWGCVMAVLLAFGLQSVQAQLMSVTVTNVDQLINTAKYAMTMAGKKEMAEQIPGLIEAWGTKGLDTKKPMGLYLNKFPANPESPPIVIYVPITSQEDFIALIEKTGITPSKEEKGTRAIEIPTGQRLFLKFNDGYAFFSLDEDELKSPADPAKLSGKLSNSALLHLHVGLSEIPKEMKEKFLAHVDHGLQQEKEKKSGESDTEYQLRLMGMGYPRQAIEHLVMDSQSLTVTVSLDQANHQFSFDAALTPKSGSRLHEEFKALNSSKTHFSSVIDGAPASLVYHGAMTDSVRKDADKLLDTIIKKAIAEEKSVMKKAVAEKIYEVIEPTLKAKTYDLALSLRSTEGQPLTGIGALRVVNGKKIEELVKGLIVEMKEQERKAIQVDAEKVGDVNIHIINIPENDKGAKDITEAFGAPRITLAFHNDAIIIALGKNSTNEVKRVLAGIAQGDSATPPSMQILVHAKPLSKFFKDATARKAFDTIFTTPGSDEVKFTMTGGDQLRWKFNVSTHFLKLIEAAEIARGQ